jgi:4-amino-4-deoxy-L-arabinose transferase-like glycosyltransferase
LPSRPRLVLLLIFACALAVQYLYNLNGTGVLSTDEPRYAAIGRAMGMSGDWIVPRLWGTPWFEKPALLYWMTAAGTVVHLSQDLAGRLPVALLSLAFLAAWFFLLKREFDEVTAAIATLLLATSAGWLVYSSLCLTDLPLAVFYSLCVLCVLRVLRGDLSRRTWVAMGVSMGLAVLAKGLVPLALSLPLLFFLRRYWRRWWIAAVCFLAVAAPWYGAVISRSGFAFIRVFFLEQQFSRLYSDALQHVQPPYYYVPVLLAFLFPWTPALFFIRPKLWRSDPRLLCLASVTLFGLLFFSVSINKLAGYVLPLLPALFLLIGDSLAKSRAWQRKPLLISCAALIATIPFIGQLVPAALTSKVTVSSQTFLLLLPITLSMLMLFLTPLLVAIFARPLAAGGLLVLCTCVAVVALKSSAYPILDEQASPRGLWRQIQPEISDVCNAGLHRAWDYGLAFYNGSPIPLCDASPRRLHLVQQGSKRPEVVAVNPK